MSSADENSEIILSNIDDIVGECCECSGIGIITETYPETICIGCGGTGIIYYGKENIN